VDVLASNGYTGAVGTPAWRRRPAFLQSFERSNLYAVADKTELPLVFLTDEFDLPVPYESDVTYGGILDSDAELEELAQRGIRGIGPWKNTLVEYTADGLYLNTSTIPTGKSLVQRLQDAGFQVHIYTLRNEPKRPDNSGYLPFDFQADADKEFDLFFKEIGVDGGFSDHVGSLASYLSK
jgi:glycerophosphoryl diester phosphodiesterase